MPNNNAVEDSIFPVERGLLDVLVIIGSISLSYHMLIALAPPAVKYPPTKTMKIVFAVSILISD